MEEQQNSTKKTKIINRIAACLYVIGGGIFIFQLIVNPLTLILVIHSLLFCFTTFWGILFLVLLFYTLFFKPLQSFIGFFGRFFFIILLLGISYSSFQSDRVTAIEKETIQETATYYYNKLLNTNASVYIEPIYSSTMPSSTIDVEIKLPSKISNNTQQLYSDYRQILDEDKNSFYRQTTDTTKLSFSIQETLSKGNKEEKSSLIKKYNAPLHYALKKLLVTEELKTKETTLYFYSIDPIFWREFLKNYNYLKNDSFESIKTWLSSRISKSSYFVIEMSNRQSNFPFYKNEKEEQKKISRS